MGVDYNMKITISCPMNLIQLKKIVQAWASQKIGGWEGFTVQTRGKALLSQQKQNLLMKDTHHLSLTDHTLVFIFCDLSGSVWGI